MGSWYPRWLGAALQACLESFTCPWRSVGEPLSAIAAVETLGRGGGNGEVGDKPDGFHAKGTVSVACLNVKYGELPCIYGNQINRTLSRNLHLQMWMKAARLDIVSGGDGTTMNQDVFPLEHGDFPAVPMLVFGSAKGLDRRMEWLYGWIVWLGRDLGTVQMKVVFFGAK